MEALFKEHHAQMKFHWQAAGTILNEIKKSGQWKHIATDWDSYCKERFACPKDKADRLIRAAVTISQLPKELANEIDSVSQAIELSKLPPEERAKAAANASKNGHITADKIGSALHGKVDEISSGRVSVKTGSESGSEGSKSGVTTPVTNKRKELIPYKIICDSIGTELGPEVVPFWNRKKEVQEMLESISKMKTAIIDSNGDPMWSHARQNSIDALTQAYRAIKEAMPFAVCTTCFGTPSLQPDGCSTCANKGLLSKWQWQHQSPAEIKKLQLTTNAAAAKKAGREMPEVEMFSADSPFR
jgi:hypothetical protein